MLEVLRLYYQSWQLQRSHNSQLAGLDLHAEATSSPYQAPLRHHTGSQTSCRTSRLGVDQPAAVNHAGDLAAAWRGRRVGGSLQQSAVPDGFTASRQCSRMQPSPARSAARRRLPLSRPFALEHASPSTRLLEKRRQMFEVQEALEAQKLEFARKVIEAAAA